MDVNNPLLKRPMSTPLTFRFDAALMARVDAYAKRVYGDEKPNRSEAIRILVTVALDMADEERK